MPKEESVEQRGLIRWLVRRFVAIYYPRIEVADASIISQTKPVLLCANHANSLIDPVIIGIAAGRPVRFMAKAPLFEHFLLGPPMKALGMVSAFRGSDDAKQVRRNLESLDVGAKVLIDGHAMGIFPEGKSTDQAHLEMIRSGAARMAIQAAEGGAKDLQVVPIGITYQRKEQFRSSVLVRVGNPIDVGELLLKHNGDTRKARRELTTQLQSRLKDVVVHLDQPEWEPWLDDLEILLPPPTGSKKGVGTVAGAAPRVLRTTVPDLFLNPVEETTGELWQRKRIADAMNYFLEHDRPRAESIAGDIQSYREQLHTAGLRVDSLVLRSSGIKLVLAMMRDLCWLLLFLVPALLGTLYHLIPFVLVRNIASRMDQPGRLTVSTHRLLVGVPIYLVWYAIVTVVLVSYSSLLAWLSLVLAPFAGLIAIHYWRLAGRTLSLLYHELRLVFRREQLQQLRQQQFQLRSSLGQMSGAYAKLSTNLISSTANKG